MEWFFLNKKNRNDLKKQSVFLILFIFLHKYSKFDLFVHLVKKMYKLLLFWTVIESGRVDATSLLPSFFLGSQDQWPTDALRKLQFLEI